MNANIDFIKEKINLVPSKPGSYQMKNKDGIIIYVGKAKDLKKRISSYFNKIQTGKTLKLVEDIYDFDYIITSSELESLILEINLIKKYNPKYNILLKDDKTYPYIELTNELYPTLKILRSLNIKRNKNKVFGPYPNVNAARKTVEILNRIYPLRKCKKMPKEVCLYYHIGECLGYCVNENIDINKLNNMTSEIIAFLNGDKKIVTESIIKEMSKASEALNYEKALELKNILDDINITLKKQIVDLNRNSNIDVFGMFVGKSYLSIEIFYIRDGLLFGSNSSIINYYSDIKEAFLEFIIKYYEKGNPIPKEIIVNSEIEKDILAEYLKTKVLSPKRGDLKKLLDLANDNAKKKLKEKEELMQKNDEVRLTAIKELEALLKCNNIHRIEAFDNSHLFGTFYVGGMVVFNDFLPLKNEYRKFKIDINTKDDLRAMEEIIDRRYKRLTKEKQIMPDLIIVDGGENQVKTAVNVINSLNLNIRVIGLKKDEKHRTSEIIDSNLNTISLSKDSKLFLFLTKIQNEVHNYAINYHRKIKNKGMFSSYLNFIPGIGEIKKKLLLKKYGTIEEIKKANYDELTSLIGKKVTDTLIEYIKTRNI